MTATDQAIEAGATDHLFQDKAAIGQSLAFVSLVIGIPACVLLAMGLKAFRESLGRVTWLEGPAGAGVRH